MKTLSSFITESNRRRTNEALASTILASILKGSKTNAENAYFIDALKSKYALSRITDKNFAEVAIDADEILKSVANGGSVIVMGGPNHKDAAWQDRIIVWGLGERNSSKLSLPINTTAKKTPKSVITSVTKWKGGDYRIYKLISLENIKLDTAKSKKFGTAALDLNDLYATRKISRAKQAHVNNVITAAQTVWADAMAPTTYHEISGALLSNMVSALSKVLGYDLGSIDMYSDGQITYSGHYRKWGISLKMYDKPDNLKYGKTLFTEIVYSLIDDGKRPINKGNIWNDAYELGNAIKRELIAITTGKQQTKKERTMSSQIHDISSPADLSSVLTSPDLVERYNQLSGDLQTDYNRSYFLFEPSKKNQVIILTTKALSSSMRSMPLAENVIVLVAVLDDPDSRFKKLVDLKNVPSNYLKGSTSVISFGLTKSGRADTYTDNLTKWIVSQQQDAFGAVTVLMPSDNHAEMQAFQVDAEEAVIRVYKDLLTKHKDLASGSTDADELMHITDRFASMIGFSNLSQERRKEILAKYKI